MVSQELEEVGTTSAARPVRTFHCLSVRQGLDREAYHRHPPAWQNHFSASLSCFTTLIAIHAFAAGRWNPDYTWLDHSVRNQVPYHWAPIFTGSNPGHDESLSTRSAQDASTVAQNFSYVIQPIEH